MEPHPIEELMKTAMESIKEMVDVNTIIGDAVQTVDGTVIIPVSRVAFGFAAGGGEYSKEDSKNQNQDSKFPFAGGSGAGVSINPVAFMVVGRNSTVKMIPATSQNSIDRVLESVPGIIEQVKKAISGNGKESGKNGSNSKEKEGESKESKEKQQEE
jgi:sporulation protein YtfJ